MKNLKEIKTTILGLILLIAAGIDLWYFEKLSEISVGILALVGIGLLFAPDKILKILLEKFKK